MKSIVNIIMSGSLALLLSGCNEKETAPSPGPRTDVAAEAQRSAVLEKNLQEEQQRGGALAKALQESECQKGAAEKSRGGWQIAAFVFGGGSLLAIFVGAALGSRARHDAKIQ